MDEENQYTKTWIGSSMDEIYGNYGPWNYNIDPVIPSRLHSVFYQLDSVDLKDPPKPFKSSEKMHWDSNHVRMPFSERNLFPVKEGNGSQILKSRWDIIQTSLLQPIKNSRELEALISSYNTKLPKLTALHHFFETVLDEEESHHFFKKILPGIVNLALQLPHFIQKSIPLLKQGTRKSISLTQLQIASLLANAFLCTFPWRKDVALSYPGINFIKLFSSAGVSDLNDAVANKLKCICHYFKRILLKSKSIIEVFGCKTCEVAKSKYYRIADKLLEETLQNLVACMQIHLDPVGVVTFERKSLSKISFPRWDKQENNFKNTKVHICSDGKIEDAKGLLQVDFANKNVGGGVLSYGCVQEEIRYIICPELIVSRLFTECLSPQEALLIIGTERYSSYEGYGDSFVWKGDFIDQTPYDNCGRRRTSVVAIDAVPFRKNTDQYSSSMILRELNKAYVGFYSPYDKILPAVATGNWGCGAFRGNPLLKSLIQLMACTSTKRDMVYFTFGNVELRDNIYHMYSFLVSNQITIAMLWRYLCSFPFSKLSGDQLFSYIQQAYFDSKNQVPWTNFLVQKRTSSETSPSTSSKSSSLQNTTKQLISCETVKTTKSSTEEVKNTSPTETNTYDFILKNSKHVFLTTDKNSSLEMEVSSDESIQESDIIESSQKKEFHVSCKKSRSEGIINIIKKIDGKIESSVRKKESSESNLISQEINELTRTIGEESLEETAVGNSEEFEDKMELDEVVIKGSESETESCNLNDKIVKPQKKITDFFKKSGT